MTTFAISAAVLVLGTYLILGAITVCAYLRAPKDPYPPEAAEAPDDPVEAAFGDAQRIVSGRLPTTAVDELVDQFDWPRYSTWLKEPS